MKKVKLLTVLICAAIVFPACLAQIVDVDEFERFLMKKAATYMSFKVLKNNPEYIQPTIDYCELIRNVKTQTDLDALIDHAKTILKTYLKGDEMIYGELIDIIDIFILEYNETTDQYKYVNWVIDGIMDGIAYVGTNAAMKAS